MSKMLVHSGTSLHRHEYSPPVKQNSNSIPRRSPLARAALSTPLRPSSLISTRPVPSSIIRRTERPLSDPLHEHTVRFQEPESDTMDEEDGASILSSEGSNTTRTTSRHRRRFSKAGSSFQFAYPAPTKLQKQRILQIRPKVLLQLHHLPPGSRPVPTIDVFTTTVVVPRVIKKFPRMFRGKAELGANDLMLVKSETYDAEDNGRDDGTDSDDEGLSNRELLAVICQARKDSGGSIGRAEIVLADGSVWSATPLEKGVFEFVTVDGTGKQTMARWWRAKKQSVELSDGGSRSNNSQMNFSIIDPTTRRHPTLATLSVNKLNIPDYYVPLSGPSRRTSAEVGLSIGESEPTLIPVDERLKFLIEASAIWVGLRKGWCPCFKYNDSITGSGAVRSHSVTMPPHAGLPSPGLRSDTPDSNHSAFAVVGDKIRRTCVKGSPHTALDKPSAPQRSVSTGSAFMQRAKAAKRGHFPSAVASGSEEDFGAEAPSLRRGGTEVAFSTPPLSNPNLTNASNVVLDTPTKLPRRPQATSMPSHLSQNGKNHLHQNGGSNGVGNDLPDIRKKAKSPQKQPKLSRWKSFSNLFKRTKASESH